MRVCVCGGGGGRRVCVRVCVCVCVCVLCVALKPKVGEPSSCFETRDVWVALLHALKPGGFGWPFFML